VSRSMAPPPARDAAHDRIAVALTALVGALMLLASAVGLAVDALYRDNALVAAGWRGNDAVTLLVVVPALAVAVRRARADSDRARLVWAGLLAYALYGYLFYLFGAAFNALFLAYVALVALSLLALLFLLAPLDARAVAARVRGGVAPRAAAAWMLVVALGLGGFHVAVNASFLGTGRVPAIVAAVGGTTNVVAALDLTLVVPFALLGAWWLRRGAPWGYALAVVWNVKGAAYMAALTAASVQAVREGAATSLAQVALWGPIGVGCAGASVALLRALVAHPSAGSERPREASPRRPTSRSRRRSPRSCCASWSGRRPASACR